MVSSHSQQWSILKGVQILPSYHPCSATPQQRLLGDEVLQRVVRQELEGVIHPLHQHLKGHQVNR